MTGGTPETKKFYDQSGWREEAGVTTDQRFFGDRETGPIREGLHRERLRRVREALAKPGTPLRLLECGCGGNPAKGLLDLCSHYTGTDFPKTGLQVAKRRLADSGVPHELREADICALPFESGSFDARCTPRTCSITSRIPSAQRRSFQEIARVIRPGGVAVLILAKPTTSSSGVGHSRGSSRGHTRCFGYLEPASVRKPPLPLSAKCPSGGCATCSPRSER